MIAYSEIEEISKNGKGKKMYQASKKMMEHYKMLEKKKICGILFKNYKRL